MNWIISILVKAIKKTLISQQLNTLIRMTGEVIYLEEQIMTKLQELEAQVRKNVEVNAAAVLLIQGFAARLEAAVSDVAVLEQLRSDLNASSTNLEAAVAANQPEV